MNMPTSNAIERFGLADWIANRALYRVRPAWLAAKAKRLLGIRRKNVATNFGNFLLDPVSMMACIGFGEAFEPEMTALFRRVIQPGDTVVDLGANEGYFTVLAARLAGSGGRVLAIEPQPWLGDIIRANAKLNGCDGVEVASLAVGADNGEAEFFVNVDTNSGASGFVTMSPRNARKTTVPVERLESLFDRRQLDVVNFMKVDIEGAEHDAVFGSRAVFVSGRVRAFVLEMHPGPLRKRGHDPSAFAPFFESCGYARMPDTSLNAWRRK